MIVVDGITAFNSIAVDATVAASAALTTRVAATVVSMVGVRPEQFAGRGSTSKLKDGPFWPNVTVSSGKSSDLPSTRCLLRNVPLLLPRSLRVKASGSLVGTGIRQA